MHSNLKRVGGNIKVPIPNKIVKTNRPKLKGPGYSQQWKFWVLSEYEYSEAALTFADDIIKLSQANKENLQWTNALTRHCLGRIIADVWGKEVRHVKRGGRNNRYTGYLNLKRKPTEGLCTHKHRDENILYQMQKSPLAIEELIEDVELLDDWSYEVVRKGLVAFFRRQKLEFDGQRVNLELSLEMSEQQPSCKFNLKSHGCQVDLNTVLKLEDYVGCSSSGSNLKEQIRLVLKYIDESNLCRGILLCEGEEITALIPHITGKLCDLSDPEKKAEIRSFSSACQIISSGTNLQCTNCGYLETKDRGRKSRKESRPSINPRCNKRFLSKEEIIEQMKNETRMRKNAEMREKFWKDKFLAEAIEIDDEDHEDLVSIFDMTNNGDVPPDMVCLWEQQTKILNTKSKNGYRWHPKIIRLCIDLYCKNPHVMDSLRNFIKLPSNKTIRYNVKYFKTYQ